MCIWVFAFVFLLFVLITKVVENEVVTSPSASSLLLRPHKSSLILVGAVKNRCEETQILFFRPFFLLSGLSVLGCKSPLNPPFSNQDLVWQGNVSSERRRRGRGGRGRRRRRRRRWRRRRTRRRKWRVLVNLKIYISKNECLWVHSSMCSEYAAAPLDRGCRNLGWCRPQAWIRLWRGWRSQRGPLNGAPFRAPKAMLLDPGTCMQPLPAWPAAILMTGQVMAEWSALKSRLSGGPFGPHLGPRLCSPAMS